MASPRVKPEPTTDDESSPTPQVEVEPPNETRRSSPYVQIVSKESPQTPQVEAEPSNETDTSNLYRETIKEKNSQTPQVEISPSNETSEPTLYPETTKEESSQTPRGELDSSNGTSRPTPYLEATAEQSSQTPQVKHEPSNETNKPILCREYWVRDDCPGVIGFPAHSIIHKAMNCIKIPCDTNTCEATHIYVPPYNSKAWPAKGYWFEIEPIAYGEDETAINRCWSCKGMLKMQEWRRHFPPWQVYAFERIYRDAQLLEVKERMAIKGPIINVIAPWAQQALHSEGHRRDVHGR